jgi:hypothetical protein
LLPPRLCPLPLSHPIAFYFILFFIFVILGICQQWKTLSPFPVETERNGADMHGVILQRGVFIKSGLKLESSVA